MTTTHGKHDEKDEREREKKKYEMKWAKFTRGKYPNCRLNAIIKRALQNILSFTNCSLCVFSTRAREKKISGRASNDNNNSNHYVEQHIKFKVA